ncbi:RagB/SusD family nutrient uptake outer membrane protein [Sphingobacterium sp. 1.A.5]|jgi:hypothetical protein|uniref:RagB/SusD family nutrient uptake outer membrane protein n=1 Tax=Sphingobacterium sp. 1.A.5 TaxID=2044604 RepID=UPI0015D48F09|nr:RagB/SusD family nutrient uptake outer membrane protein [Sphingobacterium sp. 1.A.5]
MTSRLICLVLLCTVFFYSCSKKEDLENGKDSKVALKGAVEKGPFVRGSVVTIYELSEDLTPTGKSFKSEIVDDIGSFSLEGVVLSSNFVQLSVNGFYFNEISGDLSNSPITLNALADISSNNTVNVNILSHLEEKRVKSLIKKEKLKFADAKVKAVKEIYSAFYAKASSNNLSEEISLTKNNEHSNILLGISAGLLQMASSDDAKLTEILSTISTDLETDGEVSQSLASTIKSGLESFDSRQVSDNMKKRYADLDLTIGDFDIKKNFTADIQEIDPNHALTPDQIYSNEGVINDMITSLKLSSLKLNESFILSEGLYINTIESKSYNEFSYKPISSSNSKLGTSFTELFKIIVNCFRFEEALGMIKNESLKKFQGHGYLYVALSYWQFMNYWGDPIYFEKVPTEMDVSKGRTNKSEASNKILSKLAGIIKHLETSFPNDAALGRMIAARIAMDNKDYTLANAYLNQIIDSKKFALASKSNIHSSNSESIFGVDYNLSPELKPNNSGNPYLKGNYRSIARYSEVILLAAEANLKLNNKTKAIQLLNEVRKRNGKAELSTSESNILKNLHTEFKEEMKNEGVYFAFLKRNDLAESELGIKAYQKLFPIPQYQLSIMPNMAQNPGY